MKTGATLKMMAMALIMLATVSSWAQKSSTKKSKKNTLSKGWILIPEGKMVLDKDTTKVEAFYMYETELSNLDYKEYLAWLKNNNKLEELAIVQVDTAKWSSPSAYNDPLIHYYFQHPAYNSYPLVNVSYESAQLYCKWLTVRLNESVKGITVEAMLPTRAQWVWAARGGIHNFNSPYSWGHPYLTNKECMSMCNFVKCGEQSIHYNAEKKCYEIVTNWVGAFIDTSQPKSIVDITAPVKSYYKSLYGLYNLNGNVAEMVAEKGIAVGGSWKSPGYDVRNESVETFNGACPSVGFRPILKIIVQ